jgi:hypothetical protein
MNQNARFFLINQCKKGEPIYYEAIGNILGLDLSQLDHRLILSDELAEISTYEYQNHRPLLSSAAIYKKNNDHGPGFYTLCEKLGIGTAKSLQKQSFGFKAFELCKEYWQKDENYNAFANNLNKKQVHKQDFFNVQEIDFLAKWKGKVYDKNNPEHISAKDYIKNSLGTKTKYWSNCLVKNLPGLETFNWRMWSQKGWADTPEGKIRVARFKEYTWARIYRAGNGEKDIFFTVGVDGNSKELVYKMDYYFHQNSHLNAQQKEIVEKNIPQDLRWKSIKLEELDNFNWDSLLSTTSQFISENLQLYDKLIELAWGKKEPEQVFRDFLRPQNKPDKGFETLPELKPSFEGVDKDYIKESLDKKDLGDAGEELVLHYEKIRLKNQGFLDLAEKVEIVKYGKGYDILSFDQNRAPKYIEVKTTSSNSLTPFYYSINELLFAQKHSDNHLVYRLYNYDEESNSADFFILNQFESEVLMRPINFKVYLKKQPK